jgi:hypothetical protein
MRRNDASMGEKSNMPMRGMNERMGPRMGSVTSWMTTAMGFSGLIPVQERMIRMKIAMRSIPARIWIKRPITSMTSLRVLLP